MAGDAGDNPFRSPNQPPPRDDTHEGAERHYPPFASGRLRAVAAMLALVFVAAFDIASVGQDMSRYGLLDRLAPANTSTVPRWGPTSGGDRRLAT